MIKNKRREPDEPSAFFEMLCTIILFVAILAAGWYFLEVLFSIRPYGID